MVMFPEKTRRTLEKTVKSMKIKENVYGVGLFGSWSRGDATTASDVDLLILDRANDRQEYVERIEMNGLLIDLDHVPKNFMEGPIPPEIDQKLYEMQILYDRDWSLANMKLLMTRAYRSPERVDIRTEDHIIDSDIYLSRSTSALARDDFRSAMLFATVALENILKVLVEIAVEPFSNSQFLERLEKSTTKLRMHDLFVDYLEISRLNTVDDAGAREKLKLFKTVWDEMNAVTSQNLQTLESAHFNVKTRLHYYLNPAFLQGAIMRTSLLLDSEKESEASHYLHSIFLEIVENYAWLKSLIDDVKVDYTTLIRYLESLEETNPRNYKHIVEFLNLEGTDKSKATIAIEKTRRITLKIRKEKKALIKNHLSKC
jgi:predicted nucleotidyltransferase